MAIKLVKQLSTLIQKLLRKFVKKEFLRPTFPSNTCPNTTDYVYDTLHLKHPFSYLLQTSRIDPYTLYTSLLALKQQLLTFFSLSSEPTINLADLIQSFSLLPPNHNIFQVDNLICICPTNSSSTVSTPDTVTITEDNTTTLPSDLPTPGDGENTFYDNITINDDDTISFGNVTTILNQFGFSTPDLINLVCTVIVAIVSLLTGAQIIILWKKQARNHQEPPIPIHQIRSHEPLLQNQPIISIR